MAGIVAVEAGMAWAARMEVVVGAVMGEWMICGTRRVAVVGAVASLIGGELVWGTGAAMGPGGLIIWGTCIARAVGTVVE